MATGILAGVLFEISQAQMTSVHGQKGKIMTRIILVCWLLFMVADFAFCWFLADMIIPQSEIDKIDAIGRWAKEELERREHEVD